MDRHCRLSAVVGGPEFHTGGSCRRRVRREYQYPGRVQLRIRVALCASFALILIAAGCSSSSGDDSSTTSTAAEAATTTTAAQTTTTTATTTTVAPTTTTRPPSTIMLVTWDGADCEYEGPETVGNFEVVDMTYRNNSAGPTDLGVASLDPGFTYEEAVETIGDSSSINSPPPDATTAQLITPELSLPQVPELLEPGQEISTSLTFSATKEHIVVCFGGDLTVPQKSVVGASFLVKR